MPKFCTNCGKEIPDGVAFCTECGTAAPADKPNPPEEVKPKPATENTAPENAPQVPPAVPFQPQAQQQTYQQPQPQPVYQQPPYQQPTYQQPYYAPSAPTQEVKPNGGKYGVLSTGAFFGLMLLFAIPVIGWLACVIMAFAPKNENLKHYARAMLIWIIIGIVLCVIAYFLFAWVWGIIKDYINELTDGQFGDWKEIFEQFQNGDFGNIPDVSGMQ